MKHRTGFTLVDVMVSLAVLGLLVAGLLPAVQSARSQASATQCKNNLHQLGVAIHTFESSNRMFRFQGLLRDLDAVGFRSLDPIEAMKGYYPTTICPIDREAIVRRGLAPSYVFNRGNERQTELKDNGILPLTRPADVSDGLSQTGLLAERLVSPINFDPRSMPDDPRRWSGFTPTALPHPQGLDQFMDLCRTQRASPTIFVNGVPITSHKDVTDYTHVLGPNSNSCINGTPDSTTLDDDRSMEIVSPTSLHAGGIHLLLCDGSVRFVSDNVDIGVWQALGSRNGNETVGEF